MAVYIRVRRKGAGHLRVSIEPGDETIGDDYDTVYWIRTQDSNKNDPGDPFSFDPDKPLVFPSNSPFQVISHTAKRVTVAYAGAPGRKRTWTCTINVVDGKRTKGEWQITSDGSATIKNH